MKTKRDIYIVSDSAGDTAFNVAKAALSEFDDLEVNYQRYPFINNSDKVAAVLNKVNENKDNAILFFTIVSPKDAQYVVDFCNTNGICAYDIMSPILSVIAKNTKLSPSHKIGAVHQLDSGYFDMISAVEFALLNDDGQHPAGFKEADVVLLGVSRTSKTPLSLFLANSNIKVANLPLVPKAQIPEELWEVDPKRIVGLTTDLNVLKKIRRQRMIAYGLNPDTVYSDESELKEELDYSEKLYDKLGCLVINTADRSIEETASIIMEKLNLGHFSAKK